MAPEPHAVCGPGLPLLWGGPPTHAGDLKASSHPKSHRRMLGCERRFMSCTSRSMLPRLLMSLFIFSTMIWPDWRCRTCWERGHSEGGGETGGRGGASMGTKAQDSSAGHLPAAPTTSPGLATPTAPSPSMHHGNPSCGTSAGDACVLWRRAALCTTASTAHGRVPHRVLLCPMPAVQADQSSQAPDRGEGEQEEHWQRSGSGTSGSSGTSGTASESRGSPKAGLQLAPIQKGSLGKTPFLRECAGGPTAQGTSRACEA